MPTVRASLSKHKPTAYLWLAYVLFMFIQPVLEPSPRLWGWTLAAVAAFVAIFLAYIRTEDERVRRAAIAATFALGVVSLPWNNGASTFFVYTASFLPFSIASVPAVLALFAVEVLSAAAEAALLHVSWAEAGMTAFLLLVIGGGNIYFAQQFRAHRALRAAQEENARLAAAAERERIARDLHDVLGHTLSVIALKAELAGRLLRQPGEEARARAQSEIADVEATARAALAEVREVVVGYRARGLAAEMEAARRALAAAGVLLDLQAPVPLPHVNPERETVLALALREAVTNIVRHAGATECRLHLLRERGQWSLEITDNGARPRVAEGSGLSGMRERVEALGGTVALSASGGMRVRVELPV